MGVKRWRARVLSVHEQLAYVRIFWRGFDCKISGGLLLCRGMVQPLPITSQYRVRIEYRATQKPKTWVEDPPLRRRRSDEPIPHMYPNDRPCLFHPRYGEWHPDMTIATTIIPWFLEWLVYYEAWFLTGEWQGGGEHPPSADERGGEAGAKGQDE